MEYEIKYQDVVKLVSASIIELWFIFFVIGVYCYKDLNIAFMLAIFCAVTSLMVVLFAIPVLGGLVWAFQGEYYFLTLIEVLGLPSDPLTSLAWWIPTTISMIVSWLLLSGIIYKLYSLRTRGEQIEITT